jgi:serine/threonine-protein kinase
MTGTGSASPGSSTSRPLLGAGLDTSEGRSFVRERLVLLGKTVASIALIFFVVQIVLSLALGAPWRALLARSTIAHLAGVAVMGLLWLSARVHDTSLRKLGTLDGVSLVASCTAWAFMIQRGPDSAAAALLATTLTVLARAVIVPSTARLTLTLSAVAAAPSVAMTATRGETGAMLVIAWVFGALWMGAAVAVATLASSVTYGLRRRIQEATNLGAYTLEEKIGTGGMGEVWRARHRLLVRPAAVKLIRPSALGSSGASVELAMRRFEREARATANLHCPHTVELYDFGVAEDGTLYYVMELLEGFDLETLVQRFGPQPAERVVHLLRQVCCSLTEAHENGLIHRDIKPANVFLTRVMGTADFVKVVDFGLVRLDPRGRPEDAGITSRGVAAGTPAFMAPETVLEAGSGDHRADLYAFGCVAYWLLTGALVFEGSRVQVLVDHADKPPPPPSTRTELPIPKELERLVLDCLAKDPRDRPQTASAIGERLASIVLPSPWTEERARRWWDAHAREIGRRRAVADLLLSVETRPPRRIISRSAHAGS